MEKLQLVTNNKTITMPTPEKYTRTTALEYFRENSRLINSCEINMSSSLEMRYTNNGHIFIINDMGSNGFNIYLPATGSKVSECVEVFNELNNRP